MAHCVLVADIVPSARTRLGDVLPGALDAVTGRPNLLGLPRRTSVVVLLVDGLGAESLRERAGHARTLAGAVRRRITSGGPTTTAAALTTLATGADAGEHGVVGFAALDPGADRVVNQLRGFDSQLPAGWQRRPTVFEAAEERGVTALAVGPRHYASSGFTREVLRGAEYRGARTVAERLSTSVDGLRDAGGGIAYCYVPELDVIGHREGRGSFAWTAELEQLDAAVAGTRLRPGETLLVTADHGMVDVPEEAHVVLADVPGLLEDVRHLAGEPRLLHVHLEPGADPVGSAARWQDALGRRVDVRTRQQSVQEGWFGRTDDAVLPRIGDLLIAARGRTALYATADDPGRGMVGQHGAWTDAERFVPLAVLDG